MNDRPMEGQTDWRPEWSQCITFSSKGQHRKSRPRWQHKNLTCIWHLPKVIKKKSFTHEPSVINYFFLVNLLVRIHGNHDTRTVEVPDGGSGGSRPQVTVRLRAGTMSCHTHNNLCSLLVWCIFTINLQVKFYFLLHFRNLNVFLESGLYKL